MKMMKKSTIVSSLLIIAIIWFDLHCNMFIAVKVSEDLLKMDSQLDRMINKENEMNHKKSKYKKFILSQDPTSPTEKLELENLINEFELYAEEIHQYHVKTNEFENAVEAQSHVVLYTLSLLILNILVMQNIDCFNPRLI